MASQEKLWPIYQIHRLDAKVAAVERRRSELDDGSGLGGDVALRRKQVVALEEEQRKAHASVREAELELASVEEKAKRIDKILYSGKVGNPKELQGYEGELASLGRRKDTLEEQVLTRMEESDAVSRRLADARHGEAGATAAWKAHVLAYRKELASLEAEKQALQEQRDALRAGSDADLLRQYDKAVRQRKALVGLVEQDACGACGMLLPGRVVKEYKTDPDIELSCPTCAAHLLWRVPHDEG